MCSGDFWWMVVWAVVSDCCLKNNQRSHQLFQRSLLYKNPFHYICKHWYAIQDMQKLLNEAGQWPWTYSVRKTHSKSKSKSRWEYVAAPGVCRQDLFSLTLPELLCKNVMKCNYSSSCFYKLLSEVGWLQNSNNFSDFSCIHIFSSTSQWWTLLCESLL